MKLFNWVFTFCSILHIVWAVVLLFTATPLNTTPISGFDFIDSQYERLIIAGILFFVAILAILGIKGNNKIKNVLLLIPQQTILAMSAIAGVLAAIQGHYADGVIRDNLFIFCDQLPSILLFFIYTAALLEKFNIKLIK